jgi:uncharacterized protein YndB with AHSA1/START domain
MIDTSTIAGTGAGIRSLTIERLVDTDPRTAWEGWASADGIGSWWGPAASNIDLRIGGPFEILFGLDAPAGSRGSEGCVYLSYVPGEMISFTWNAPPHLPLRETNTWVVITFTPDAERSLVRLVHTGFLTGPDWDDYMGYFSTAWERVLDRHAAHHAPEPGSDG